MNIILPCSGKSSRYQNTKPKYLLTLPNGQIMFNWALKNIPKEYQVYMTILKEHEKKYKVSKVVERLRPYIKLTILNKSDSQVETIRETIKRNKIKGAIFCKDCDNQFKLDSYKHKTNYVSVVDLEKTKVDNIQNKGYVNVVYNEMVNKKIIGNLISCGGYYFTDANNFLKLSKGKQNISEIINKLDYFEYAVAEDYIDLGTQEDFINYRKKFANYIVDLDGVLFENGSEYFEPNWKYTEPIKENVKIINKKYDNGNYIILMTARSEEYRRDTKILLDKYKIKYHKLIMGLLHAKRICINDYDKYYPTSEAINIKRNNNNLGELL